MKMILNGVRLAFPVLFEAKSFEGSDPAFSAALLIDPVKQKALIAQLQANMMKVAKEKWGDKADAIYKGIAAKDQLCLHDGDTKAEYDGFEGMMFVNTRSKVRPLTIDRDKSSLTEADGKPYGGCYVNASIEIWAMENQYGKRINAQIRGVQFEKDGDAFGAGGAADVDEFDEIEATDASVDEVFE